MTCILRRYAEIDGKLKPQDFTCDQVRQLKNEWLEEYRKKNRCDLFERDYHFERYQESMNEFLDQCSCQDYAKCLKCPPEDHEGAFCRCEKRNIRIAKEQRKRGNLNGNK